MDSDLIIFYLADGRRNDNVENDVKVETSTFIIVQPVYNKSYNSRLIFFTCPITSQKINHPLYYFSEPQFAEKNYPAEFSETRTRKKYGGYNTDVNCATRVTQVRIRVQSTFKQKLE